MSEQNFERRQDDKTIKVMCDKVDAILDLLRGPLDKPEEGLVSKVNELWEDKQSAKTERAGWKNAVIVALISSIVSLAVAAGYNATKDDPPPKPQAEQVQTR